MHLLMISMPGPSPRRASGLSKVRMTGLRYEIVDGVEARKWRPEELPIEKIGAASLTAGEVGCYVAHLRALQRIIDYQLPCACILEDDFCFEADPDFGLAEIESSLPSDFRYVHLQRALDWNPGFRILERCGDYERIWETPLGATGYIAANGFAQEVLANHSVCSQPIDVLYSQLSYAGGYYKPVKPLVGVQVGLASEIDPGKMNREDNPT